MMSDAPHARMSPSQLSRILACPASVRMAEKYPSRRSSTYADEGTMLHGVMESRLTTAGDFSHGPELTDEQKSLVAQCYGYLTGVYNPETMKMWVERRVSLSPAGLPQVSGTADVILLDDTGPSPTVHVIDWKFGGGVRVDVDHNPQFMAYGLGACYHAVTSGTLVRRVVTHVVQPRLDNFANFEYTAQELSQWATTVVAPVAENALSDTPRFNPGAAQCRWCPAAGLCPARREQVQRDASVMFAAVADTAPALRRDGRLDETPEDARKRLSEAFARLDSLESAMLEIKARAAELCAVGQLPGFKMVAGRRTREWIASPADVRAYLETHGVDPVVTKPVTVAQAEKACKALAKEEAFQALYGYRGGKPIMVPEDDKRPALTGDGQAEMAFSDFAELD